MEEADEEEPDEEAADEEAADEEEVDDEAEAEVKAVKQAGMDVQWPPPRGGGDPGRRR